MTIPGIGALIAPARIAASDGGQAFGRGRDRACWLGLVPRQHATGKARRRGIAQRGNGYLRRLLVHAARSLKRSAKTRDGRLGAWRRGREARAPPTGATVARAAKLVRWSWAVLAGTSRIGRPAPEPARLRAPRRAFLQGRGKAWPQPSCGVARA